MFVEIDEFLIGAICDDIELCEEIEYPVYSKYFYPPQVCKKLSQMSIAPLVENPSVLQLSYFFHNLH